MRSNSGDAFMPSRPRASPSACRFLSGSGSSDENVLIALSYHVRFASADAFETSLSFSSSLWQDRLLIMKKKVLFICVHNSARSQMAKAFLNNICGDHLKRTAAGLNRQTEPAGSRSDARHRDRYFAQ